MKSTTISKEQRQNLLIMAKFLFPKNETWRFDENTYSRVLEYADEHNHVFYMHWYEFCILRLSKALFAALVAIGLYKDDEFEDWLYDDMSFLENPIDFFYEQFQKLN